MRNRTQSAFLYLLLAVFAALMFYPVFYTFAAAFMTPEEASAYPPPFLPKSLYIGSFLAVLKLVPIVTFIKNSFIVSTLVMIGQLFGENKVLDWSR